MTLHHAAPCRRALFALVLSLGCDSPASDGSKSQAVKDSPQSETKVDGAKAGTQKPNTTPDATPGIKSEAKADDAKADDAKADDAKANNAKSNADADSKATVKTDAKSPNDGGKPATDAGATPPADSGLVIDAKQLRTLAMDEGTPLPGSRFRHGVFESGHSMLEGGMAVARTESFALHRMGSGFVGRIKATIEDTPEPPWQVAFALDAQQQLHAAVWKGLPGTSAVTHEFEWVSMLPDGTELQQRCSTGMLSTTTDRVARPDRWTFDVGSALEYTSLWGKAPAPTKTIKWLALSPFNRAEGSTAPGSTPRRVQALGEETVDVGGHPVSTQRYVATPAGKAATTIWIDGQGLMVRSATATDVDAPTGPTVWTVRYLPKEGDPLHR